MTNQVHERPPSVLFGVPVDDLTMDETIAIIGQFVETGRRLGRVHQIGTINLDFLVNAIKDADVRRLLQDADICIPDGMPVLWSARAAGMPLRERVAGADLVPSLAEHCVRTGWKILLFGSAEGTAERAADLLALRYPGAVITGISGPFITDMQNVDQAVLDEIIAVDADILCVALGNPKQERFISQYGRRLGVPVMIGVGGTLDFLIGGRKRAPVWMQRAGIEWLARLAQEPSRLGKRYLRDSIVFLPNLLVYLRRVRALRPYGCVGVTISPRAVVVSPAQSAPDSETWRRAIGAVGAGALLVIDLSTAPKLRVQAVAAVVGLLRVARRAHGDVQIRRVTGDALLAFERLRLTAYLNNRDTSPESSRTKLT